MTGPEHYAQAERLLHSAAQDGIEFEGNRREHDASVAEAQVHATLALAAATIDASRTTTYRPGEGQADAYPSNDEAWNAAIA